MKIAEAKEAPRIPQSLTEEAKDFIKSCLQRDYDSRPTAQELLAHPFVVGGEGLSARRAKDS